MPGVHGSNVYLEVTKVVKTEETRRDGTKLAIADGVAGDQTGFINFRVIGEPAKVVQEGAVVAFRNCLSIVRQEHHLLSLDVFGRITVEDVFTTSLYLNRNPTPRLT